MKGSKRYPVLAERSDVVLTELQHTSQQLATAEEALRNAASRVRMLRIEYSRLYKKLMIINGHAAREPRFNALPKGTPPEPKDSKA